MRPSALETVVFATGLAAAVVVGVVAYDRYGMYGDGPRGPGFRRTWDAYTNTYRLEHEAVTADGRVRRVFAADGNVVEFEIDREDDGRVDESFRIVNGLAGLGFSRAGGGVIDAWRFSDANGQTVRVEISTRQDGRIDRWEHYTDGALTRADLDTNGNGKRDRWETYEDGLLTGTVIDANEDGRPDPPSRRR